jgi:hypothetical protein
MLYIGSTFNSGLWRSEENVTRSNGGVVMAVL